MEGIRIAKFILVMATTARWIVRAGMCSTFHGKRLGEDGAGMAVGKGRFGAGSGSAGRMDVNRLLEISNGLSEEDQDLFKRNMGNH